MKSVVDHLTATEGARRAEADDAESSREGAGGSEDWHGVCVGGVDDVN